MVGGSIRAFLAVEVPAEVLDISGMAWLAVGYLKCTRPDQRHLTLLFMGSAQEHKISKLEEALSNFRFGRFKVHVKGISAFSKRPKVIFADIAEGREELEALAARLGSMAKDAGIAIEERKFEPHVTIARVKGEGHSKEVLEGISEHSGHDFGVFECAEIKLKKSVLKPEGPEYTDLLTLRASAP